MPKARSPETHSPGDRGRGTPARRPNLRDFRPTVRSVATRRFPSTRRRGGLTTGLWRLAVCLGAVVSGLGSAMVGDGRNRAWADRWEQTAQRLADPSFSGRRQAMLRLWRSRDEAHEAVQRASRHHDPEIAARATQILDWWRRGVLPDTPPRLAAELQQGDVADAVGALVEAGEYAAAAMAVEESLGTIDREAVQGRVSRLLSARFPLYARMAFEGQTVADFLRLIDLAAESKELALCRLDVMEWSGIPVDDARLLPASAETWPADERHEAMALLLLATGRLDEAVAFVADEAAGDDELRRAVWMLAGHWDRLGEAAMARAMSLPPTSTDRVRHLADALLAAERVGNGDLREQVIDLLSHTDGASDETSLAMRWQALAVHGEIEAACRLLQATDPEAAAEVALAASQAGLAFELLGTSLGAIELGWDAWVSEALDAQRATDQPSPVAEVTRLLTLVKCLAGVGRHDLAWRIAEGLSSGNVAVGRIELRAYVLHGMPTAVRAEWTRRLAVFPGEETLSTAAENALIRALPDTDAATFSFLMEAIESRMPTAPLQDRLRVVASLLEGRIPDGFDPQNDFRFLYQQLTETTGGGRQMRQIGGRVFFQSATQPTMGSVRFFSRHGQVDYAERCLRRLRARGDVEAMLESARRALAGGRLEDARQGFDDVWESVAGEGGFAGGQSGVNPATQALAGLLEVADRQGNRGEARRLRRLIRLVLATPAAETRLELCRTLAEAEPAMAADGYRRLLPLAAMGSRDGTAFYTAAYAYALFDAERAPDLAADWFDLAFTGTLAATQFVPAAYVSLPLITKRWRVQAALRRADRSGVERTLDRLLRLDPLDIRLAEEILPEIREAGMAGLANRSLDRILDEGLIHTRRYPGDATTANNLAWIAAVNGRRLEDALALSQQAVRLQPDSAVYRDTLAEVLFRLGRRDEAILIERACLLDDPGQWHLHEQIEKFTQTDPENLES